jgi:signal transduction histidine kinase
VWNSIERRQTLVDVLVAIVAFIVFAGLDLWRTGPETIPIDALFAVAIAFRRSAPGIALAIAWVGAIAQLFTLESFINGNVLIAGVIYGTSLAERPLIRRLGLASSLVGGVVASVKLVLITGTFLPHGQAPAQEAISRLIYFVGVAGVVAAALALFWLLGTIARVRRAYTTERVERLERERELLRVELRVAQETERTRITREMHDAIGHSLAVIIAQSDGARYAVAKNPDAAKDALGVINRSARSALDDVSEVLSVLKGAGDHKGSPGVADIPALVENMTSSGLELSFDEIGARGDLSTANALALYRVVQESLTNALKHGGPSTKVSVVISWLPGEVVVTSETLEQGGGALVEPAELDEGWPARGERDRPGRTGYGIAGMNERVRLVGGTVEAGPRTDGAAGYRVLVHIPRPAGGTE